MDPILYWTTIVQCFICLIGLIFNGFFVYVVLKNKQVRTSCCSIFILVLAINDCFAELSLVGLPTVLTVFNTTIPLKICFFAETYGPFAQINILNLLFLISIDRFFSIIFPIKYKFLTNNFKWKYICAIVALSSLESCIMVYLFFMYVSDDANASIQVYCQPSDIFGPVALYYSLMLNLIQNIGTFVAYIALWLVIQCKCVKMMHDKVDRRVLRSLFVLMLVTFVCWFPAPLYGNFIMPGLPPLVQNVGLRAIQQFNKIGQSGNALILYFSSSDYRKAMQKEFTNMTKWGASNTNNNNNSINIGETAGGGQTSNSNGRQSGRTIVNNFVAE